MLAAHGCGFQQFERSATIFAGRLVGKFLVKLPVRLRVDLPEFVSHSLPRTVKLTQYLSRILSFVRTRLTRRGLPVESWSPVGPPYYCPGSETHEFAPPRT